VTPIACDDDAPDDDEHADGEQQMHPPWSAENERANDPDDDERDTDDDAEIHDLTYGALVPKLLFQELEANARDGEVSF
jgi:hypothetical protein